MAQRMAEAPSRAELLVKVETMKRIVRDAPRPQVREDARRNLVKLSAQLRRRFGYSEGPVTARTRRRKGEQP